MDRKSRCPLKNPRSTRLTSLNHIVNAEKMIAVMPLFDRELSLKKTLGVYCHNHPASLST